MNQVLGELLPLALGVAISPIPIIAVILMLLAPRAGATSFGFLIGWLVGILVAAGVFVAIATNSSIGSSSSSSSSGATSKTVIGVLLLLVAARQWRGRPKDGEPAKLPAWMKAIDSFTPVRAAALAFALAAINPKNLLLCAAAGIAVAQGDLTGRGEVLAVVIFAVLAGLTVLVPVVGYAVASERMTAPLGSLRDWLEENNATVMAMLLLVIGVVLIGKGIGGF